MDPKIEKLRGFGWESCEMKDLIVGDRFRMWVYPQEEMKWVLHKDIIGNTEWEAISEPYMHPKHKVWTINVKG